MEAGISLRYSSTYVRGNCVHKIDNQNKSKIIFLVNIESLQEVNSEIKTLLPV